ncbi:MAG: cyclic nucleotide-binding domain-containing protein [Actinomycetota bacterium]
MKRREIADTLATVPLFSRCTTADLRTVARHLEVVDIDPGTTLITEGDEGETFYLILDGEVEVSRDGEVVGMAQSGAHFGELALLDPAPRAATVVTKSDCRVGILSVRMFRVIVRELPTVSFGLLGALAGQLREAME